MLTIEIEISKFENIELNKTTVSKKVVEKIKDLIIDGTLKEGEKLPAERSMATMLNVSRNTIREAYKMLAVLGYIEIKHGLGVFVIDENASLDQITSSFFIKNDQIMELFEMRKVLESSSIKWAVERGTDEQINELERLVENSINLIENEKNISEIAQSDQDFHLFIAEISGNSVLYRTMLNLVDLLAESRSFTMDIPGRMKTSINDHKDIVEAVKARDVELAERKMLKHLDSVEKELITKLSKEK